MRLFAKCPLLATAVVISLLSVGCAPSAKEKLVGKWRGGVEFDDEAVQQKLDEAGNPVATAIVKKMIEAFESGTMDIQLKADDSYTSSTQLGPFSKADYGTWEIVNEQSTQATIRFASHEGNVQDATVLFSEKDVITAPFTGQGAGLGAFRCNRVE